MYGTFKKRRGRRKGKKHHCVAKGLRLRIPLCNLTVFNSYILMPRRPLCQSTSAPSRSHLTAAKWIISRRGCRLPPLRDRIHIHHPPALARRCPRALPRAPPLDLGSRTVRTKRCLTASKWDTFCFSQVSLWSFFSFFFSLPLFFFFFLKEGGKNLIEGFLPSAAEKWSLADTERSIFLPNLSGCSSSQ